MNQLDKKVLVHQLEQAMAALAEAQVEIRSSLWTLQQEIESEEEHEKTE